MRTDVLHTAGFLQTLKSNAKKVFLQGLKPRLQNGLRKS